MFLGVEILAKALVKGLDYPLGQPGKVGWWDPVALGGTTKVGAGGQIKNWTKTNEGKEEIDDLLDGLQVHWPVEEITQIPKWPSGPKNRMSANIMTGLNAKTGGYGFTDKMFGATHGLPNALCNMGGCYRDKKGATCNICYNDNIPNFKYNSKNKALWRNAVALLMNEGHEEQLKYASAMASTLPHKTWDYGTPYFRHSDAGDKYGEEHIAMDFDIARNILNEHPLKTQSWMPTAEHRALRNVVDARGWDDAIPENMEVSASLPWIGQSMDDDMNRTLGLPTIPRYLREMVEEPPQISATGVGAAGPNIYACPASDPSVKDDSCEDNNCPSCWEGKKQRKSNMSSFFPHIGSTKGATMNLRGEGQLRYDPQGNAFYTGPQINPSVSIANRVKALQPRRVDEGF